MYQRFYGLRDLPFELTPNFRFLFFSARHREALSNLQFGLSSAKPLTVLIGEAGTGKTTLVRAALASEPCRHVRCLYLNNPTLTRAEFVETLAQRFELSEQARHSKAALLSELEATLNHRLESGGITALVIDEAQSLSLELLEEIRLLANIETETRKLLPVVLAGQPELSARLNEPALRQLKQRVALRCELTPFTLRETAAYIVGRISVAGGEASRLFTREAVTSIHEHSHGIPRTINVICDNSLVTGMALGRQPVDRAVVHEVCRDFDLGQPAAEPQTSSMFAEAAALPQPDESPLIDDGPEGETSPDTESDIAVDLQPSRFRWLGRSRR